MANNLRDLDITRDELDRIGEALKKKEFRDLLVEYCEELNDPATKKQYEEEITELEKERGVQVTFIKPTGVYVIKTSIDGSKLAFINICTNELVEKPSSSKTSQNGSSGLQWSLPHLLAPPRDDMSKKAKRCTVFDVIFHPDTLHLSSRNSKFREMINNIACEAVESNFNVVLDKANLKFPKLKYKGVFRSLVIRNKVSDPVKHCDDNAEVDKIYCDLYKQMDQHYKQPQQPTTGAPKPKTSISEYTFPKFIIKHRNDLDIQDFTYDTSAKMNAAIPKELIVEINLPLLKSSADLILDVTEKSLKITSEKPAKYKLDLTLPYTINEDCGNAKFDVDSRKLIVTLPVKRKCTVLLSDISRYDSGVDSDNSPLADSPSDKSMPLIEELQLEDNVFNSQCSSAQSESEVFRTNVQSSGFLKPDLHYLLPDYSCNLFDNILSFTLNVKNVDSNSIEKEYNEPLTSVHLKFSSISSGYFPIHYAFFIKLPLHFIDSENLLIEAWDNNVILQLPYHPCDKNVTAYYVGTSQDYSEEKFIEEPSIINNKHLENTSENSFDRKPVVKVHLVSEDELTIVVNPEHASIQDEDYSPNNSNASLMPASSPQNIKSRSFSESSVDESSFSQSPGKSILKSSHRRHAISRSVSESSVDDFLVWSSFENCSALSESLIPEEGEMSSSMKKTVRFSSVVSKQMFRYVYFV